ncbi:vacuole membrane protein KMS1-like isoform X2 [Actinidia eriantha]|uniref:vacuole membrane protein KMS1-like isoform X2 n=1 Tax=Actinidia eriantha TaxID=165200 RepID=UPI002586C5AC|nr:vacuole membrane protein KMS1-like isoform X2 [Actinidia eriantha]
MGSPEQMLSLSSSSSSSSAAAAHSQVHVDSSISALHEKHLRELENLKLATQPLKTLKYFTLAVFQCLQQPMFGTSAKCGWLMVTSILAGFIGIMFTTVGGPHDEHVQELLRYLRFGIWWLALGVASSIGLGSGLHTFVLYLGPHIALFTIKSVHCGRVDIKIAPYDTILLKSGPSWADRDCTKFGPLKYAFPDSRVPLSSVLPQVQLEAILWGIGTALGELPPYFIARAAYKPDSKSAVVEDLDSSLKEDSSGIIANHLKQLKQWLLSHSQHLNFFTILVLASVPNPLFDLAGIMCGQLGIPFWKFFSATLIGKAIIKTHIQTAFIILLFNNQLLDLVENELIWVLRLVPGIDSILPNLIAKLHIVKEKYMTATPPASSNMKKWDLSFASVWNTVVWLVLMNFFMKIVKATAQNFLKEQQEKELASLRKGAPTTSMPAICSNIEVLD